MLSHIKDVAQKIIGDLFRFYKEFYRQRGKVKTVFFVIKRKYGNFILGKSFEGQKKELIFRLIAHNVDWKLIFSVVVLGF